MIARQRNTTDYPALMLLVSDSDHITGVTGATLTVTISKNGGAFAAPVGAVSEIANGWYMLAGAAADRDTLGVVAIHASAANADPVDMALEIVDYDPYTFATPLVNLDAAVSSRSTLTAQQVWEYATRTLTGFGTLVADIWANATRTLTQTAAQIASVLSGSTITIQRGDTLSVSLTGLGNITGNAKLWFTAKENNGWPDSMAMVQIERTAGLLYLNRAAPVSPVVAGDGAITVNDAAAGSITITLTARATALLCGSGTYDVQWLDASGDVHTLASGALAIADDVTRAVA